MRQSSLQSGGRTSGRRAGWLAVLPILLACTDTATTSLEPATVPPSGSATTFAVTTPATAAIEDVLDRVFPALSDDAVARGLRTAVEAVLDALSRKDGAAAENAVERAEQLLDVYARTVDNANGDAADLDAIALALASVRP